ncbi:MAG: YdeI/OmpD-associated family protein [bacterium]
MKTNLRVDDFFNKAEKWREEFRELRNIILRCPLKEELKWGKPSYSFKGKNIVLIQGFKEYCALLFFKGALLKDAKGLLARMGATQAARQIRFTHSREIAENKNIVKAYIEEAIEVEKFGLRVRMKKTSDFKIPEEFQTRLEKDSALKIAFEALTPGRQRGYLYHFSAPQQSKTRESRIDKCLKPILRGKGLNDR